MDHIEPAVIFRRLSEKDESATRLEFLVIPFESLEKDHLHLGAAVAHRHADPLGLSFACQVPANYLALNLNVGHVLPDVGDSLDGRAVYVAERVEVNQIVQIVYAKLFFQKLGTFGTYALKVLYFALKFAQC